MKFKLTALIAGVLFVFSTHAFAANVTGKITLDGASPAVEKIKTDADPNCKAMHPAGLENDEAIVSADGSIKDVFVYVKTGLEGQKFEAPKEAVTLDQHGCQYNPKVFGIQVGQPLEIKNSDNTLHNVHSLSANSPQFNLGMPLQNMKLKKTFAKPEVMVKMKCEVHPWMHAYAGVLDNPFYAVTNADGSFEIKNLPVGKYTIEAWHAKFGTITQEVTIAADTDAPNLALKLKAA